MLPAQLVEQEQHAKTELESFVGWKNLKVDSFRRNLRPTFSTTWRRGYRIQTPVYERFIISFDQKVLTQNHWDVESAFEVMKLKTPKLRRLS